ncbi:complement C5 [Pseudophryne corroboree]|uniref:complement C5 n=1 Tax=Pseudophryne corroboree TaxID=495146 RepID=UPI003081AB7C
MTLLHIAAFLLALYGRSQCQEQTYIVMAPRLWRIGAQETVLVQAFRQQEDLPIKLSLYSYPDRRLFTSQSLQLTPGNNFQGLANLQIQPSDLPRATDGKQQFVYLEAQSKSFTKEETVPVTHQNGFLFIQTDKPIYTPTQSVKVRVYSMNEELRPARRTVTVTYKDPEQVKMDVVSEHDATGIISFPDFKLPTNPRYGIWTLEAAYDKDYITSTVAKFEVKEYVLPRFFVTIQPERNYISFDKFQDFKITVKASYYYGKNVEQGKIFIRYGIIDRGERKMLLKSIDVLQIINGEATFRFNSERAIQELQYSTLEDVKGSYLYIAVSVEESFDSQSEESENTNVKYVISPYTLKLIATPLFVKPNLPYSIKVQVKDTLDSPVGRISMVLTGDYVKEGGETSAVNDGTPERTLTDDSGTASFVLNIPADVASLEFRLKTEDGMLQEDNQGFGEYTAISYQSVTKSYLYISWLRGSQALRVGDFLNVNVVPNSPYMSKLTHYSYLVISKGKILAYDTVERVPGSHSQSLNIGVTSSMIPSFRLLVYYIVTGDATAEIITDSIWVDVEEKCVNNQQVQLSTATGSFKPKDIVPLTVRARSGSLIALSAIDVAIYDVAKKVKRPLQRVLRKIEESDLGCGAGAGRDNVDVFHLAGLTFLTNANIRARKVEESTCTDIVRSKRSSPFGDEILTQASKYHDKRLKKCCLDGGACFRDENDCTRGIQRVKKMKGAPCVQAFTNCCQLAKKIKAESDAYEKDLSMGRILIRAVLDIDEPEIRSYFPESWLWEERLLRDREDSVKLPMTLPDSLTTWEIQGIGMSDRGLCEAEPVRITVSKDLFLDVQLPYSVVRGEQLELQVTAYNYLNYRVKGCVSVSVGKEICLINKDSATGSSSRHSSCYEDIQPLVPKSYTYTILPLELGLHPIRFTLQSLSGSEVLEKKLLVVAEGIKAEQNAGFILDPQGLRGTTKRQSELSYRVPGNIVPKSKISRMLFLKGNILGELISIALDKQGVETLVNRPPGNSEAELMRVAPIVYLYRYLETKQEWRLLGPNVLASQVTMKRKLREGVSSILSFRNGDYSYSVWRNSDPSTWLTAFALRIFGAVQLYIDIDYMDVCSSLLWLIKNCQTPQGYFIEKAASLPVKLQGTIPNAASEKALYLTAYVIIGIQKSIHMCNILEVKTALDKAVEYVSANAIKAESTFTLAVATYALTISETSNQSKQTAKLRLQKEVFTKGDVFPPIYRYWKDTLKKFDATEPSSDTARMVETTAYALLAFLKLADKDYAKPVIRWLTEKQLYGGGFYSTQDTITALDALTEVAILDEKLSLNMEVKISYRNAGDFQTYRLTEKNPYVTPVEVPLPLDLIISTRSFSGIVTGQVQTKYNMISSQDKCRFDLKISRKANPFEEEQSIFSEDTSQTLHLEACARYRAQENELPSSGQAVMEITLVTGMEADDKQLNKLVARVDQYITDYRIEDGKVLLYFNWIPADEYVCATILVRKMFKVAMMSPGVFKVYEFHSPDEQCTEFYNPFSDYNLVRICTGDACRCIAGECPKLKSKLNQETTTQERKRFVCKSDIVYAYKAHIVKMEEDGDFVKYTAKLLLLFNKGKSYLRANKQIRFIKKKMCTDFIIDAGEEYLFMGQEGTLIRDNPEIQYEYPLDASTWVEWWPTSQICSNTNCAQFASELEDFLGDLAIEGCQ